MKINVMAVFTLFFSAYAFFNVLYASAKSAKSYPIDTIINQNGPSAWDQNEYEAWKQKLKDAWDTEKIHTLTNKINNLVWLVDRISVPQNSISRLYAYNFLREILGRDPVKLFFEIDGSWFQNVMRDLHQIYWIENDDKHVLYLPTISQEEFFRDVQMITDIGKDHAILSEAGRASCSESYVSIEQTPDWDKMLFGIYHEFGHVQFNDSQDIPTLNNTRIYAFSDDYYKLGQTIQNFSLDHPMLASHLKIVDMFVALAKAKLTDESETGRIIKEKTATTKSFWNAPQDNFHYINIAAGRGQESRADLLATQTFLQQKHLKPVLSQIKRYGTSDYLIVEGSNDEHPSDLERALYIAGFLFSQGIDVNKELRNWEHSDTCIDFRRIYNSWNYLHTEKMGDFMRIYKDQEPSRQAIEYDVWKNERELKNPNPSQMFLISAAQWFYKKLQENPEDKVAQKRVLFNYNYAREKNNITVVESIQQINQTWLFKQCAPVEIGGSAKDSCTGCCIDNNQTNVGCICPENNGDLNYSTIKAGCKNYINDDGALKCYDDLLADYNEWKKNNEEQVKQSISSINLLLSRVRWFLKKAEKDSDYKKWALIYYNYARELNYMPTIETVNNIDKAWLETMNPSVEIAGSAQNSCIGCTMLTDINKVACSCLENKGTPYFSAAHAGCKNYINDDGVLRCQEDFIAEYYAWKTGKIKQYGSDREFLAIAVKWYAKKALHDFDSRKSALFHYNYLRELENASTIETADQIDKTWLETICPSIELTGSANNSCGGCSSLENQNKIGCVCPENDGTSSYSTIQAICKNYINVNGILQCERPEYTSWKTSKNKQLHELGTDQEFLISTIKWFLKKIKENPNNDALKQWALYNYAYLRELNNLPLVEFVDQIDVAWLDRLYTPVDLIGMAQESCFGCLALSDKIGCTCEGKHGASNYSIAKAKCASYSNNDGVLTCDIAQPVP